MLTQVGFYRAAYFSFCNIAENNQYAENKRRISMVWPCCQCGPEVGCACPVYKQTIINNVQSINRGCLPCKYAKWFIWETYSWKMLCCILFNLCRTITHDRSNRIATWSILNPIIYHWPTDQRSVSADVSPEHDRRPQRRRQEVRRRDTQPGSDRRRHPSESSHRRRIPLRRRLLPPLRGDLTSGHDVDIAARRKPLPTLQTRLPLRRLHSDPGRRGRPVRG